MGFLRLLVVTTLCLRMVTMIHLNNYCLYDLYVFLNGGISNSKVTMIYATQTTLVDMWNALSKSREFYVPYLLYVHVFFFGAMFESGFVFPSIGGWSSIHFRGETNIIYIATSDLDFLD